MKIQKIVAGLLLLWVMTVILCYQSGRNAEAQDHKTYIENVVNARGK